MSKELDEFEKTRYNRQIMIPGIGIKGQRKLKNSKFLLQVPVDWAVRYQFI